MNGQVFPLNLRGSIDTNTNDMLVNAGNNTWAHNWQKFQGKYLPNSLRFEKNGWAAGWNVYNFDYDFNLQKLGDIWVGIRQYNKNSKIISIYQDEHTAQSLGDYIVVDKDLVLSGNATISNNQIIVPFNGKNVVVQWNRNTRIATITDNDFTLIQENNSDNSTTIKLVDKRTSFDFNFDYLISSGLKGDYNSLTKFTSFDGTYYKWGGYTLNRLNNVMTTPEGVNVQALVTGNTVYFDYSVLNKVISVRLNYNYERKTIREASYEFNEPNDPHWEPYWYDEWGNQHENPPPSWSASTDDGAYAYVPVSAKIELVTTDLNLNHKLITDLKSWIDSAIVTVTDNFSSSTFNNNYTAPVSINLNGFIINATYHYRRAETGDGWTTLNSTPEIINNDYGNCRVTGSSGNDISFTTNLYYNNCVANIPLIITPGYVVTRADGETITVAHDGKAVQFNQEMLQSVLADVQMSSVAIPGGYTINLKKDDSNINVLTLKGILSNGTVLDNDTFALIYKGNQYQLHFSDLANKRQTIRILSTDVRLPEKTRVVDKIIADDQFQLVKQQWNSTVEVENFWWVDPEHILELGNLDFILKRKTNELDDWNGDRFEPIYNLPRYEILKAQLQRYFVPSVYNSQRSAVFVLLEHLNNSIVVRLYDIRSKFNLIASFNIFVIAREIGQKLNPIVRQGNYIYFNSYNPLTAEQILANSKWSSTLVDNRLIIGCHFGNNYDQWSFVFNLNSNTIERVIQGYGFVGLHGDLTGGMLPDEYCDVNLGFNSTVLPLSVLGDGVKNLNDLDAAYEVFDVNQINRVDKKVVGTAEQQWYIQKSLYGIVSHIEYDNGNFIKRLVPITNNFSAIYGSPSFTSSMMADLLVAADPLATLFKFESGVASAIWNIIMAACMEPMLFSFAPRYSFLCYLQQTFGQYAYVHYNSSKSLPEEDPKYNNPLNEKTAMSKAGFGELQLDSDHRQQDPVLNGYLTFDKQKFTQKADAKLEYGSVGLVAVLIAAFSDALSNIELPKPSLNEEIKLTNIKDKGKEFVENVAENTGNLLASALLTQSKFDTGLTSVVTGLKSIDMFYSTSDHQQVFAGPGFVEHQYVADCVAQSVTDTQAEGRVYQFYMCIRQLSEYQMELAEYLQDLAISALQEQYDNMDIKGYSGISLDTAIKAALLVAIKILQAAQAITKVAFKLFRQFLDVICARGLTVSQDGMISRHALSVEGKHKYGEKNEVFMWPCWGTQPGGLKYTDEFVDCGLKNTPWKLSLNAIKHFKNPFWDFAHHLIDSYVPSTSKFYSMMNGKVNEWMRTHAGDIDFYQAACFGRQVKRTLPNDMVKIEGVESFMAPQPFKNQNIGMSDPVFVPSIIHDYIVDKNWELSQCGSYGMTQWLTVKDTKIINGPASNIVIRDGFCGVAAPYVAIEVKRGLSKEYMRPWAVTPNTLALNCTGFNTILDNKIYHAFDGISYRLVDLVGSPKLNGNRQSYWYAFQVNDRFKRSNILPPMELQGNFEADPSHAVAGIDELWSMLTITAKEKGLTTGTIGEDKDATRWSIPIFTEEISTLPAAVKTLTAFPLAVVDGVTGLVTKQIFESQSAYKAPLSIDFVINKKVYRVTEEYLCEVNNVDMGSIVNDLIPILGLKYIGSTTTSAYFYSRANRCYYMFSGQAMTKLNMLERFRDIKRGYWDFINHVIVMPCLMSFTRLERDVKDNDTETDNIIVPVLSNSEVSGELPPPITTIFNDRSWYKIYSLPSGLAYQGPNRVIINRDVFVEYMLPSIKANLGKWRKINKEVYSKERIYPEEYKDIMHDVQGVDGWTHNQFILVTSPLGTNENTDCMFEWIITFCWPIEMDYIYNENNYACVNITAETMTPGGKVLNRPTHVYLTKELFTRSGNYGYYTFRYQSKNGSGNRERLFIWSDQYVAISGIDLICKPVTNNRTEQLTLQVDVQNLKEL